MSAIAGEIIELATAVYPEYARLLRAKPQGFGGCMLLVCDAVPAGPEPGGPIPRVEALLRAANIAGAATLLLGGESKVARGRVRSGVCDFLVNSLDEGLRILKNELRRKQPVAVYLLADPGVVLSECLARGVQPDAILLSKDCGGEDASFAERGALLVSASGVMAAPGGASLDPAPRPMAVWSAPGWSSHALELLDAMALAALKPERQPELRLWLARAPRYLSRNATIHAMPMEPDEAANLTGTIAAAMREERLPAGVTFLYKGEDLVSPLPASEPARRLACREDPL